MLEFGAFEAGLTKITTFVAHHPLALLLAVSLAFVNGCSEKPAGGISAKANAGASVPVIVAKAETQDIPVELRNIGNVEAYATVTIRSQITGQIMKVHFQEGQEVKAGDLLFTIDPRPYQGMLRHAQADLKRDQAQLVSARLEFERQAKLLENKIASRDDYDKAEASFHALEATVMADESAISNATLNVEFTSIRSPVEGRTGNLFVREGNIVKAPDDTLVTITQIRPIYVTFSVPEQDLPAIRRRMREAALPVEAQILGEAEDPRGELSFIDNVVDMNTGRIKLKATFPNTDNALWPGQYVQATLVLSNLTQATTVPAQAIQTSQTGDFVFVVKDGNTVEKRPVTVGYSHDGKTVVQSGVHPGETVVTDGQLRLAEGSKVTVQAGGSGAAAKQ
jgi:multidrug efflux system membrane fusion protein